jgi:hypothetical protein
MYAQKFIDKGKDFVLELAIKTRYVTQVLFFFSHSLKVSFTDLDLGSKMIIFESILITLEASLIFGGSWAIA